MAIERKHKRKILIADNSVTVQKLVHLTFAEMDFDVITASDGPDALTKAKTDKPDFLLADCRLEQLDGIGLCDLIRRDKALSRIKVVLLRGPEDESLDKRIQAVKPDAVLLKPFEAKGLKKMVMELSEHEEEGPTVKIPVHQKLEEIAATILSEHNAIEQSQSQTVTLGLVDELGSEMPTQKKHVSSTAPLASIEVSPEPTRTEVTQTAAPTVVSPPPEEAWRALAEMQIRQWIDVHLAPLAERLIKEEILRRSQPK